MVDSTGPVTTSVLVIARNSIDDHELAAQVCRVFVDGLDIDGVSMSLLTRGAARAVLGASDRTAAELDELEFGLGEGVATTAATRGRPVLVPDLGDPTDAVRWPVFIPAARHTGVGALFAMPMRWGTVDLGVLELYRRAPGRLPADQLRDALAATEVTGLMLLGLRTDPGEQQWLQRPMLARAEIHQATGMVLAQLGLDPVDALARLRAHAYAEQRGLDEIAADVIARRLRFGPDTT